MQHAPAQLREGQVRVAYAWPERLIEADRVERYLALLDDAERQRYARFRFDQHRHEYLVAHALLRTLIARYAGVAAADLTFNAGEHGKPALGGPAAGSIQFNLSHTTGLVACALARSEDVGVDVEYTDRRVDILRLASTVFSEQEQRCLNGLADALQRERFFTFWTLKEAYIKAVGMGLALPLQAITFEVSSAAPPRVSFASPVDDHPEGWHFEVHRMGERHRLAVGVRKAAAPIEVTIEELEP